ncbi:hypothetical protein M569_09872 [Genlisea aurea]|uniref:Uncharacterized protein n=1 Tax=Genlisea aurea TaxID=192259 RepID=S8DY86_9LAMI|nr:hypothetical protein M569_09872 [Genlisea aurea]
MKGNGQPPPELLVCFPARSRLNLMPKPPMCSPARAHRRRHSYHFQKSTSVRNRPVLWGSGKEKNRSSDVSEPTSPKVTCAGQIKVRPRRMRRACEGWTAVMAEIERFQSGEKQGSSSSSSSSSSWRELMKFKRNVVQFMTCLRRIRLDLWCLGHFPDADVTSEDDETEEKQSEDRGETEAGDGFSNWFMIVEEENKNKGEPLTVENNGFRQRKTLEACFSDEENESPAVPPANALLLMRCRSAPARGWVEEEEEKKDDDQKEEKRVVGLSRFSGGWFAGGIPDFILRSRSCKR